MARTSAWRSAALAAIAAAAFACKEQVTAPGHCPELCASDSLVVVDTVLTGILVSDTSIRGFTRIDLAPIMIASNTDSVIAYPLILFPPLPQRWFPAGVDTAGVSIGRIDSVTFDLRLDRRDTTVHNLRLLLYHLPVTIDTLTTFDSVSAVFSGAPFDSIMVLDTSRIANVRDTVRDSTFIVQQWTPQAADSFAVAVGIAVRADAKTMVRLLASDLSGAPPTLRYYVHGAAPRDTFQNVFALTPNFDSYVQSPEPSQPASNTIVVGNQPAARAILRFKIPRYFVDTVNVVRATLLLTTTAPVQGIPSDTAVIAAEPILRDFGGKSVLFQDATSTGSGTMVAGQTGTVSVEIGAVMRLWRGTNPDSLPRSIMLRNASEDFTNVQLDASGLLAGATAPKLQISFIRPFRFGVP